LPNKQILLCILDENVHFRFEESDCGYCFEEIQSRALPAESVYFDYGFGFSRDGKGQWALQMHARRRGQENGRRGI